MDLDTFAKYTTLMFETTPGPEDPAWAPSDDQDLVWSEYLGHDREQSYGVHGMPDDGSDSSTCGVVSNFGDSITGTLTLTRTDQ